MSRAGRAAIAMLCVGLALGAPARRAVACSCVARDLPEHVEAASAVFLGVVLETDSDSATFDVRRVYKGDPGRRTPISNPAGSSCSVSFLEGRRYVVFASAPPGGPLATSICAGTTDDLSVAERLGGAGSSPSPRAAPTIVVVVASRTIPIAAAAAMALLVAAAAFIAVRAQRRPRPIA